GKKEEAQQRLVAGSTIGIGADGWADKKMAVEKDPVPLPGNVARGYEAVGFTEVAYGVVTRSWGVESGPDGFYSTVTKKTEGNSGEPSALTQVWALQKRGRTVFTPDLGGMLGGLAGPIGIAAATTAVGAAQAGPGQAGPVVPTPGAPAPAPVPVPAPLPTSG